MGINKSFDEAMVALKKLRADKLKRRGSTGRGIITVELTEKDLESKTKVKKALTRALMKKIK